MNPARRFKATNIGGTAKLSGVRLTHCYTSIAHLVAIPKTAPQTLAIVPVLTKGGVSFVPLY